MAITLGTFSKLDDGAFAGNFKTINVTVTLAIVPVERRSDKAPDYRVYAGQRYEIGAGWSAKARESGKEYINLKLGSPEFGPHWLRCRLVELDEKDAAGNTHIALWEPRD